MRTILFCLALLSAVVGRAQIFLDWYSSAAPAATLLLDDYPNAAAAYSLRLLRTAYTGNCIEVRRSNDNATQNIGFAGGVLDTAAMKTFCGANDCFVRTWYDQSGNGRNAVQTTNANQPRIVNSGVITRVNGRVAIDFIQSSTTFLSINPANSFWTFTGNSTALLVARNRNSAASQYGSIFSQFQGTRASIGLQWNQFPNAATAISTDCYNSGGIATGSLLNNTQYLAGIQWQNWSTHKTNGNSIIKINGVSQAITAWNQNPDALPTPNVISIGRFDNSTLVANYTNSDVQEIIIYISALNAGDFSGAETNINSFYNIY